MNKTYIFSIFCLAVIWLPVSAWMMPKISNAPVFSANPSWYISSIVASTVIAILIEFVKHKFRKRK